MQRSTAIFLVLLRLAIGWHFLVEGWSKVQSTYIGPTVTNRPFTSEDYFRHAAGPLAEPLRSQIGDADEIALARLTVQPLGPDQDPSREPFRKRMPAGLKEDWDAFRERIATHYGFTDEQREQAKNK